MFLSGKTPSEIDVAPRYKLLTLLKYSLHYQSTGGVNNLDQSEMSTFVD